MPVLKLFHSSLTPGINQFHPLSHFGSYKQAIIVAANKIAMMKKGLSEVEAYLYEVELSYGNSSEIIEVKDGGSPRARMLLMNYAEAFDKNTDYFHYILESNNYAEENGIDPEVEARNRIVKFANGNGHKIFSYNNDVEVDSEDNISYCVIFPSLVKVVKVSKIATSDLEEYYLKARKKFK
jgi:hypothetical protein